MWWIDFWSVCSESVILPPRAGKDSGCLGAPLPERSLSEERDAWWPEHLVRILWPRSGVWQRNSGDQGQDRVSRLCPREEPLHRDALGYWGLVSFTTVVTLGFLVPIPVTSSVIPIKYI